ncbi:MAG: hypothetical protein ABI067_06180, partial [Leifsonia sp.]
RLDIQKLTLTIITTLHETSLNQPPPTARRRALNHRIVQRPPRNQVTIDTDRRRDSSVKKSLTPSGWNSGAG